MRGRRPPVPIVRVARCIVAIYLCYGSTGQSPSMSGRAPSSREGGGVDGASRRGCSSSPSSAAPREPDAATSCANASTPPSAPSRRLSYGSLYPALRDLLTREWIAEVPRDREARGVGGRASSTSSRIPEGTVPGACRPGPRPSAWEDDEFAVHLAFFARTTHEVRLHPRGPAVPARGAARPGRGPRSATASGWTPTPRRCSQHGEEQAEREVRWLEELITIERNTTHT